MTISDSTIRTDVWTAVKNKIVAAALGADVNGNYKDKLSVKKPQIVIAPINKDEAEFKFGSINGKKTINIFIDVYADTSLIADTLSQGIDNALAQNDIDGMDLIALSSDTAFVNPQEIKYKLVNLVYTYQRE